jgi:hypothetical protein
MVEHGCGENIPCGAGCIQHLVRWAGKKRDIIYGKKEDCRRTSSLADLVL